MADQPREVQLVMPAAPSYGLDRPLTPFDRRIEEVVKASPASHLEVDPCLALAAAEYGRHIVPRPDGSLELPKALQSAVLHHAGCTDGWVTSHLFFSSEEGEEDFMAHLKGVLADVDGATWIGVGRSKARAPYRWSYAIFLAERQALFEPLPRQMAAGTSLKVAGTLLGELEEPRVLLLEPGGEVQTLKTRTRPGGRFQATAKVGRVTGEHWLELLADGPLGPQVVALFPVYVGVEPPRRVTLEPPPDESMVATEADAEQLMFKLLNADRARFGLAPLVWDEALARIARGHSADMSEHDFFAHVSPGRGTLEDRFGEARYAARVMAENISRNDSVYDAQEGLMLSLGHRENILNTRFTHVGIGAVFARDEYGRRTMFLTQNFSVPQRALSGGDFRREVLRAFQAQRKDRKLKSLNEDKTLQEVASRLVRQTDPARGGQSTDALSSLIRAALQERKFHYRAFYVQTHTVPDPEDVQLPQAALKSGVSRVALGVFPVRQPSGGTLWKTLVILTEH